MTKIQRAKRERGEREGGRNNDKETVKKKEEWKSEGQKGKQIKREGKQGVRDGKTERGET